MWLKKNSKYNRIVPDNTFKIGYLQGDLGSPPRHFVLRTRLRGVATLRGSLRSAACHALRGKHLRARFALPSPLRIATAAWRKSNKLCATQREGW